MYLYTLEKKNPDTLAFTNTINKFSKACCYDNQFKLTNFKLMSPFKRKHTFLV